MIKKIFFCVFIILILLLNSILAADVAYIYKSKAKINEVITEIFEEHNLEVDFINEKNIPEDFSNYRFIFVGDENFKINRIPVSEYRSLIFNSKIVEELGLSDSEGVSRLFSKDALAVNYKGQKVKVYTHSSDKRGVAIQYFFLDKDNKASSLKQLAGTYSTSSGENFGDVISYAVSGDVLSNGLVVKEGLCFFGITETSYWTSDARELFKKCLEIVNIPRTLNYNCFKDSDCGSDGVFGELFCESNKVYGNFIFYKCNNPGTIESFCENETLSSVITNCIFGCENGACINGNCNINNDCDDSNVSTDDYCVNQNCMHLPAGEVVIVYLTATSTTNSVTLNFSASPGNSSAIKSYYLRKNKDDWIYLETPISSYSYLGLSPDTSYVFYIRAIDNLNRSSQETNISIKTLKSFEEGATRDSSGSSSSRSGSGQSCITMWNCSDWSLCKNEIQTRTCGYPSNYCKPSYEKPSEIRSCRNNITSLLNTSSGNEKLEFEQLITDKDNDSLQENDYSKSDRSPITGAVIGAIKAIFSFWGLLILLLIIAGFYLYYRKASKL